jgi:anti-sigma-K factor RskA
VVAEPKTAVPVAEVYWDTSASRWVITANLQPLPADKVYQLWFVTATEKISAGLLQTDRAGHGFAVVDVPKGLSDLKAVAITLEPSGGSLQPTTQPLAVGIVG